MQKDTLKKLEIKSGSVFFWWQLIILTPGHYGTLLSWRNFCFRETEELLSCFLTVKLKINTLGWDQWYSVSILKTVKLGRLPHTKKLKEYTVSSRWSQWHSNILISSGAQEKRSCIVSIFTSPQLTAGFPKQMQCLLRDVKFYFVPLNIYNLKHPYLYIMCLCIHAPPPLPPRL